jgi:predicted ATPase
LQAQRLQGEEGKRAMIHKLTIRDPNNTPLSYWGKEEALTSIKEIAFQPGVNVLYGKNKSGKSSILKLVATFFFAIGESEKTNITSLGYRTVYPWVHHGEPTEKEFMFIKSAVIEHDGQGIVYANYGPRDTYHKAPPGIYDLFAKYQPRTSISVDHDKYIPESDLKIAQTFFATTHTPGPPTLMIDTPDAGMDLIEQFSLWEKLSQVSPEDYQLIIATNSPFALDIPGFNYIELTPGFYSDAKQSALAWANGLSRKDIHTDMDKAYSMGEYRSGNNE